MSEARIWRGVEGGEGELTSRRSVWSKEQRARSGDMPKGPETEAGRAGDAISRDPRVPPVVLRRAAANGRVEEGRKEGSDGERRRSRGEKGRRRSKS